MKNAFKLFKMDLKKVAKTPAVWVILAGLAILPSFYAWFNLWAMWDPYSNTGHIKVAVVNEDKGDKVKGKEINVGNTMVKSLKKNDSFDWQFVSREKADHEIKMGKYFAGIYIPSKFSHQITGTLRKHPEKADVDFKVNQKINAVASKLTDTGSSMVVEKANEQFNKTVTKALLEEANKVGLTIEDNVPTINKIKDAVYAANNSLPKINKFADTIIYLNKHQDSLDSYANDFRNLGNYKGDILSAQQKLNDVNAAIPELNEKAKLILALNAYMPKIEKALNFAADDVPNAFPKINQGVNLASQGISVADRQLEDAKGFVAQVNDRAGDYKDAVGRAQQYNQNVQQDLQQNQSSNTLDANQQATNTTTQSAKAKSAGRSYSDLKTTPVSTTDTESNNNGTLSNKDVKSMDIALTESLLALSNNMNTQAKATQQDNKDLKNIAYGILATNRPNEFAKPLDNVKSRLEYTTKYNQQMIDILQQLENNEDVDLSKEIKKIKNANNQINRQLRLVNQLSNALANGGSGTNEAAKVLDNLPKLDQSLTSFRNYIKDELNKNLLSVSNDIMKGLADGQASLSTIQSKLNSINQVITSGQAILKSGQERINKLQTVLPSIERDYITAMSTAKAYFPTAKKDVAKAASFVRNDLPKLEQQLTNATASVNKNLPTLFSGYDQAVDLLDTNQPKAKKALSNLADFSENKLPDVEKDLKKANKIFKKLDKDDAVDKLIDTLKNDLKKQADVIANPINKKTTDVFPVKDYGSGMTPFYTALSVWVGALLMVSLLSVDNKHKGLQNILTTRQIFLGKAGFFFTLGIIQAFIVSVGDLVILKASVESPVLFVAITVFSSLIFNAIVYTCVSLLGNPGKAIAIILLVLQIAGGGGTFPIQTTPQFFQNISPYLPFTYAIDSLRETVGGIVPEILITKLIILTLFGIGFFVVGLILKPITDPMMKKVSEKVDESNVTE
ncbi:YhgE/Pip domain-containing protein [Staphylococcus simiae]|uniref:YhgE/Pip domain-containing protein n=1 Tax=Staphylococcus simiae TaxID=308354 RepID=UPI001A97B745|nr:YhgE/Pip domain-containing protein [Staphylococcus simiae]MBO1199017.1 YhgE/Pip domain-containing protein [Staphylococcus simiae]MBO1201285.1 YhgE/Pip domain-containing protein [Staphylococcus simiae]MBO1203471.1 YhgE/Pip domain-containing protein [Staphylococcus simiae]MBO1210999.1 YhgE/Pip domain-containing protein [Staphylococcus simiae]MBO1229623.1 YhgE/Pip domain-containing protein [Staphylococcus simiae]